MDAQRAAGKSLRPAGKRKTQYRSRRRTGRVWIAGDVAPSLPATAEYDADKMAEGIWGEDASGVMTIFTAGSGCISAVIQNKGSMPLIFMNGLSLQLNLFSLYRLGQIVSAFTPMASAINLSPFGHLRVNAFESVVELSPASRETAASVVPFFFIAAMISA